MSNGYMFDTQESMKIISRAVVDAKRMTGADLSQQYCSVGKLGFLVEIIDLDAKRRLQAKSAN